MGANYGYRIIARTRPTTELFVSVGAGLLTARFQRTYVNDIDLYVFGRKPYINAGLLAVLQLTKEIDLNLSGRYLYVPTMKFDELKTELSLKSFTAGLGISYSF